MVGPLLFVFLQTLAQWFGLVFSIIMFTTALMAAFSLMYVPGKLLWNHLEKPKTKRTRKTK